MNQEDFGLKLLNIKIYLPGNKFKSKKYQP